MNLPLIAALGIWAKFSKATSHFNFTVETTMVRLWLSHLSTKKQNTPKANLPSCPPSFLPSCLPSFLPSFLRFFLCFLGWWLMYSLFLVWCNTLLRFLFDAVFCSFWCVSQKWTSSNRTWLHFGGQDPEMDSAKSGVLVRTTFPGTFPPSEAHRALRDANKALEAGVICDGILVYSRSTTSIVHWKKGQAEQNRRRSTSWNVEWGVPNLPKEVSCEKVSS